MITIRSLQGEERLDTLYSLNMYAFHASPPYQDKEEWAKTVRERQGVTYHALFEDGSALAGAASTAMTQNVRGKLFPASGVWGVATHPAARRKGYCAQVMASLLAAESQVGQGFLKPVPVSRILLRAAGIRHPAAAQHRPADARRAGAADWQGFWRPGGAAIDRPCL